MNLFDAVERLSSRPMGLVQLESDRCLRFLDRFSECTKCTDICPEGAIVAGNPPAIDVDSCKGCLACVAFCPTGACQSEEKTRDLYNCVLHNDCSILELVCALHPEPQIGRGNDEYAVQIHACLASLGPGVYTGLSALGFTKVFLRTDVCSTCRWQNLRQSIRRQVEQTRALLGSRAAIMDINYIDHIENPMKRDLITVKAPNVTRRELFRGLGQTSETALVQTLTPVNIEEKRAVNSDRLRLIAAIEHLLDSIPSGNPLAVEAGLAIPEVLESCLACGTCVRSCPAGVLQLDIDEEKANFVLFADPRLCIGCEICIHVCASAAMTVNHMPSFEQVFPTEMVVLKQGELMKCKRCGTHIARREGVQLCPVCEAREKNPFQFSLPPGFEQAEKLMGHLHKYKK